NLGVVQKLFHFDGQFREMPGVQLQLLFGKRSALLGQEEREDVSRDHLRSESLRRGDADLRPGVRVEGAVSFARHHRTLHIADRHAPAAFLFRLAQRGQRVGGLARLRNDHHQRGRRKDRVAVTELRSVINFDGDARQFFDQVLGHHRRVPGRATRRDLDVGEAAELLALDLHRVQKYAARVERYATQSSVADGARLLVNLLEHEMLEAALFSLDRIPVDALNLRLDLGALSVGDAHAGARQRDDLVIAQEEDVARVWQQRRNVRSDKIFAVAQADDDGRAEPGGHDLSGLAGRHRDQRVYPAQLR